MNHDYAHCLDQTENCPKKCFRRQLNDELKANPTIVVSWMHFRGTGMRKIEEEEE